MAWLTGWNYRKAVTITNAGSVLSDYQVLMTADTASLINAGKMRSDCGDIRFTDTDGSFLLNYWIESGCNTTSTKIWTKIYSVPIGAKTIYLYYGNATPPSDGFGSNGTNTFIFFDDGEGKTPGSNLTTGGWTNVTYGSYANDRAYSGSISLKLDAPGTIIGGAYQTVTKPTPNSWILETKVYDLMSGGTVDYGQFGIDNTSTREIGLKWEKNISATNYGYIVDGTKITTGITRSVGWHTFRIVYDGSNLSLFIDGIQVKSPSAYSDFTYRLRILDQDNNGVWFDNIIYRKYAPPEPTSSVSTTEELPIGYLDIYSTPTDADIYTDGTFRGRTHSLLSLPIGSYNLRVSKTGYADYTETIVITEGFTLYRSYALISLSNITATDITLGHTTPCTEGTCIVTVDVTWTNMGTGSGDFVPNIKIDNIVQAPVYTSQSLGPGASVPKSFTVVGLPIGAHTICPDPN